MSKRKTGEVNIVEGATRYWLGSSVMIGCIALAIFALDVQEYRSDVTTFPYTFNASCHTTVYLAQAAIVDSLTDLVDDVQNVTNTEYIKAIAITRKLIGASTNFTTQLMFQLLKSAAPVITCGIDEGLALTIELQAEILTLGQTPQIQCPAVIGCDSAQNTLNEVYQEVFGFANSFPTIPTSITAGLDEVLQATGVQGYINDLANFPAPAYILNLNSSDVVAAAFANDPFGGARNSCSSVTVQFSQASSEIVTILYWVEVGLWLAVAVVLIGVFIWAIIRQFPNVFFTWVSNKITNLTNEAADRLHPSLVWLLEYINFKLAIVTTCYGLLGLLIAVNLSFAASATTTAIDIWVQSSLSPAFATFQQQIQTGINAGLANISAQLNQPLTSLRTSISPAVATLDNINAETKSYFSSVNSALNDIGEVSQNVETAINCLLPLSTIQFIITSIVDVVDGFFDILGAIEIQIPRFTFPNLAGVATQAVQISINALTSSMISKMYRYEIIFILLSIALGILLFQGLLILLFEKLLDKGKQRWSSGNRKSADIQLTAPNDAIPTD